MIRQDIFEIRREIKTITAGAGVVIGVQTSYSYPFYFSASSVCGLITLDQDFRVVFEMGATIDETDYWDYSVTHTHSADETAKFAEPIFLPRCRVVIYNDGAVDASARLLIYLRYF